MALVVLDRQSRDIIDRWPAEDAYLLHTRPLELRIGNRLKPTGARLAITGFADMQAAAPDPAGFRRDQRATGGGNCASLSSPTAALASVLIAYLVGIPLLADRLVAFVPPSWDIAHRGDRRRQMEATLTGGTNFDVCDPDPASAANTAIARFVATTFVGLDSPVHPDRHRRSLQRAERLLAARRSDLFLSAMLDATQTQDEFEGVLAHELGHVYYRHRMHTLIATSATGLLVGFVLGDMSGLSWPVP